MALDAQQVEVLQNSTPTNWAALDAQLAARSNWDTNRFADDGKLHVKFFMKAQIDQEASVEANRPIYRDVEFIEIMVPGDKHNIICRPVWDQDIMRFPKQYDLFKAGNAEQLTGTPLRVMPGLTDALIEELAYLKIRTVEQLAGMADSNLRFMGARDLKTAAQKFLDKSQSSEVLIDQIEQLKAQVAELMAAKSADKPEAAAKK